MFRDKVSTRVRHRLLARYANPKVNHLFQSYLYRTVQLVNGEDFLMVLTCFKTCLSLKVIPLNYTPYFMNALAQRWPCVSRHICVIFLVGHSLVQRLKTNPKHPSTKQPTSNIGSTHSCYLGRYRNSDNGSLANACHLWVG